MNEHLNDEQLGDYLRSALAPEADAAAHAHLAACTACTAAYEREARLIDALRLHARASERELPDGVRATVRARAASGGRATLWENVRALLRPAVLVPAAAIVAAAFFVFPRFFTPSAAPRIAAGYYLEDHASMNGTMPFAEGSSAVPVSLESSDAP